MSRRSVAAMLVLNVMVLFALPVAAEQVIITGKVLSPASEPVSGAKVFTYYCALEPTPHPESIVVASGTDGRFEIVFEELDGADEYTVGAFKDGYAVGWTLAHPDEEVEVQLGANPVSCSGQVVDHAGQPVAGVAVSVMFVFAPPDEDSDDFLYLGPASILTAITDAGGDFQISGLPVGKYVWLTADAEGKAARIQPDLIHTSSSDIRITLEPAASISGRVTRDGQPVEDVHVSASGERGSEDGFSGPDGAYTIGGLVSGQYTVAVREPLEGYIGSGCAAVWLSIGEQYTGADLELITGGLVEGRIVDADTGEPVAGATVYGMRAVDALPVDSTSAESDEAGQYVLRLAPGEQTVYPADWEEDFPYATPEPSQRHVTVVGQETVTGVDFTMKKKALVSGTVRTEDGQLVANATISVAKEGSWSSSCDLYEGMIIRQVQTDEQGCFALRLERRGYDVGSAWMVLARDTEHGLAGVAFLEEDTDQTVEITLKPGAYVTSRVIDPDGQPISRIPVMVELADPGRRWFGGMGLGYILMQVHSDDEGYLTVGPLPTGYKLQVLPTADVDDKALDAAWEELGTYKLVAGQERELPPLRVNVAGRSIRGYAVDRQGTPQPGAVITGSKCEEWVTTGPDGQFELSGLPSRGDIWLIACHTETKVGTAVSVDPGPDFQISLILRPLGAVTGQLLDKSGKALADVAIQLYSSHELGYGPWDTMETRILRKRTRTDADGNWRMENLMGGLEYNVWVDDHEDIFGHAEFTAKAGETVDVGNIGEPVAW